MSQQTEGAERPNSSSRQPSRRSNAPLVIVSERGRHSDESRRIVRAQAARASAAQSRVTRARNREGRESGHREPPQSPAATEDGQPPAITPDESIRSSYLGALTRPFDNPFSSGPRQQLPQQPEPSPYQHIPIPVTPEESKRSSYLAAITKPFTNPFGSTTQQSAPVPVAPLPSSEPPLFQHIPIGTPTEAPAPSYLKSITRPFDNPFNSTVEQVAPQQPDPLQQPLPSKPEPPQQPLSPQPAQENPTPTEHLESYPAAKDPAGNPLTVPLNFIIQKPLVKWLATLLGVSAAQLFTNPYAIPQIAGWTITGAVHLLTSTGAFAGGAVGSLAGSIQDTGGGFGRIFSTATGASQGGGGFGAASPGSISTPGGGKSDPGILRLPRALPRGFGTLNQRTPLTDALLGLLTRTSCFDFGSPGVEERVHGLLFDLIIGYLKAALSPLTPSGPPVQDHLRIACTCITIYQGQRANGRILAEQPTYDQGLEAAWSEVRLLDQQALADSRSAEASLWAVFIISVTTASKDESGPKDENKAGFFQRVLQGLLEDLQLQAWDDVRRVLLDFIYPVSFLDEPCRAFWEKTQGAGLLAAREGSPMAVDVVA